MTEKGKHACPSPLGKQSVAFGAATGVATAWLRVFVELKLPRKHTDKNAVTATIRISLMFSPLNKPVMPAEPFLILERQFLRAYSATKP
jgi:hypothetical protein